MWVEIPEFSLRFVPAAAQFALMAEACLLWTEHSSAIGPPQTNCPPIPSRSEVHRGHGTAHEEPDRSLCLIQGLFQGKECRHAKALALSYQFFSLCSRAQGRDSPGSIEKNAQAGLFTTEDRHQHRVMPVMSPHHVGTY